MGLGKTLQSLTFIAYLKTKRKLPGPHLVVCPLAVIQNWASECKQFTPSLTFCKIHGTSAERNEILSRRDVTYGEYDVYITTYDTLKMEEAWFTETIRTWHTLIIDEAHNMKNEAGKLAKSLCRVTSNFRLLLTGTPLQNNLHELWTLLNFLLPDVFTSSGQFDRSFDLNVQGAVDGVMVGKARMLLEPLMLRRIKEDVEKELKPKVEVKIACQLTLLQKQWYKRILSRDSKLTGILTSSQLMAIVMQLRKLCNHPKQLIVQKAKSGIAVRDHHYDELAALQGESLVASSGKMMVLDRLLARLQKAGSRVLIFSFFRETLDLLEEYMRFRAYKYLRLDGNTNKVTRELDVRDFNAPNSEQFVFLISTRAGGVGINLASADVVILYDSDWNPQVDLQAQDRAHRIGQRKQVKVFRLMSEGTVEERILERARKKACLDAAVVSTTKDSLTATIEDEEVMNKLGREELFNLLAAGVQHVFRSADAQEVMTEASVDKLLDEVMLQAERGEGGLVGKGDLTLALTLALTLTLNGKGK